MWYGKNKEGIVQKIPDEYIVKGWKPTMWNFKRDPKTKKPMRDLSGNIITTTPKIQEAGKICPNLLEIDGDLPRKIVKFLSLRNRQSVINGWLSDWRLGYDGRLSAEITGYTPTFRVKHSKIVNLPKASPEVLKGYEVRSLFVAEKPLVYVSADAAALENRTVADYTWEFDDGEFAKRILNGDSHSFQATVFFPEIAHVDTLAPDFNKDDPKFKPFRNKAKSGAYAMAYGCSPKKLAATIGVSETAGKIAYDNYWEKNKGLGLFKQSVEEEWSKQGKKKYVQGKDGKLLSVRSKHLLVNLKGQNLGATVITYAACLMDNYLGWMKLDDKNRPYYEFRGKIVRRLAAFHDQIDFECDPEVADEVGQKIVDCIIKAGKMLSMKVELNGEYKIGANAAEIH